MRISFISRRPIEGFYSLESYFARMRASLLSFGLDVHHHVSPYPSQGLLNRLRIVAFARRHQADLVHVTGDIQFASFGTDPARTVVTVADCGRLHQLRGWKREVLRQLWFRLPLRRVAAITVISEAVKEDLLHWVPELDPARIHVVPVSISPAFRFSPKPFHSRCPRILQVGTTANKNIERLAQALQGIPCTLVVIGRLSKDQIRVLQQQRIVVENHCGIGEEKVVELYESADLLAFASTLEGFGMPILEAQSVGRPVVTSAVTSMPDVAGNGAVLVDPFSVDSIRAGLLSVIADAGLRAALIERGQRNVRRFDSDSIAKMYMDLYRSLWRPGGQR